MNEMTNGHAPLDWTIQHAYASLNVGKNLYPGEKKHEVNDGRNDLGVIIMTSREENGTSIPMLPLKVVYTISSEPPGSSEHLCKLLIPSPT